MLCIRRNFQTIFTFRSIEAYLICYITGIIIKKCQQTSTQNQISFFLICMTVRRKISSRLDVYKRQIQFQNQCKAMGKQRLRVYI